MKYVFFSVLLLASLFASSHDSLALELSNSSGTTQSGAISVATPPTLSLRAVEVVDAMHVHLTFSSPVDMETLKLKITKQWDSSMLKIATLSGTKNNDSIIEITLITQLQEGSAYTLTAVSAIWKDGSLIKDGALALKDFVTPIPLKSPEPVMSAAPNPNAILVKTGATTPVVSQSPSVVIPVKITPLKPEVIVTTKELPLTGMNPFFLLIVILPLAFFFLRKKI